jgi:uncharacterized phage protein (TIGR01671 family)
MAREIKFRGVCAISKEIVHGDLIHGVGAKSNNVYILPNRINLAGVKHCDPLDGVKVLPESVGQFTGFKDENDKEVFEGDIISSNQWNPREYKVIFEYGEFSFVSLKGVESPYTNSIHYVENFSVIGNIHQNPELLP